MEAVLRGWLGRYHAEYQSAALASELLHWLMAMGLSSEFTSRMSTVVAEELKHAELSRDVYLAAGGSPEAVSKFRMVPFLGAEAGERIDRRAMAVTAEFFCVGETVAAPLFRSLLSSTTVPVALDVVRQIWKDEASHGALGRALLEELLGRGGSEAKDWLRSRVSGYVEQILAFYGGGSRQPVSELQRSWGVLSPDLYTKLSEDCVAKVVTPHFRKLGLMD